MSGRTRGHGGRRTDGRRRVGWGVGRLALRAQAASSPASWPDGDYAVANPAMVLWAFLVPAEGCHPGPPHCGTTASLRAAQGNARECRRRSGTARLWREVTVAEWSALRSRVASLLLRIGRAFGRDPQTRPRDPSRAKHGLRHAVNPLSHSPTTRPPRRRRWKSPYNKVNLMPDGGNAFSDTAPSPARNSEPPTDGCADPILRLVR